VGNGLNIPAGVAVDGVGDVFIADAFNNRVVEVPAGGGAQITIGSGLNNPTGVAVDAAGDVFIAEPDNALVVEVPADGGAQTTVGSGLGEPTSVAVDGAGDVFIADAIRSRVVKVSPGGVQSTVGNGFSFPTGVAVDATGDVFVADYSNNDVVEVPAGGGTQTTLGTGLSQPYGVAVDGTGDVFIADSNNNRVVEVPAGGGAQITVVGSGLHDPTGVAVQGAGVVFVADSNNDRVLELQRFAVNLGTANVCPAGQGSPAACSQSATLTYNVTTKGTAGGATALTGGASNLDFTVTGNTCTGLLEANSTCTVNVTFTPGAPGLRMGAIQVLYVYQQNQSVLANTPAYGEGKGPAVAFGPGTENVMGSGLQKPNGVAVDGAGDVFIADTGNDRVVELPANGGAQTTVVSGLNYPYGVAVDGAGDLFVTDTFNNQVVEVPGGGGAQTTVGSGLNTPFGVTVDTAGDVFISDTGNNRVVEVPVSGGAQFTVGTGLNMPHNVAVDGAGDVFIADFYNNRVVEVPANGGPQTTVGTGLSEPADVAVDGAGDLFIVDALNFRVVEVPAGGGAQVTVVSGLNFPQSMALDGTGDLFIADSFNYRVVELQRSQSPSFSFASTAVGSTSSDSPQSFTIQNIGNEVLDAAAPGLSIGADFQQVPGPGSPEDCTSSFSLAPGVSCNLSISFTPKTAGNLQETAVLRDNALNAVAATQTINLSGTATGTAAYDNAITVTLSSTQLVYPGAAEATVAVAGSNGSTATGSVTIYDGATALTAPLTLSYGAAHWWISPGLNAGTHSLSASYSGDSHNPAGQSAPIAVTVSPAPVSMTPSCWNQSFSYGGNYSCTVSLSFSGSGTVSGSITYTLDGGAPVSVPLSGGTGAFTLTQPATGNHSVVIAFAQQGNFAAASPSTQNFTVTPAPTQIQLTPSSYYLSAGSTLTLSASLTTWSAGAPSSGVVTFLDNGVAIGTVNVNPQGQSGLTVVSIAAGSHNYTAQYAGTTNYASVTSSVATVTAN
jgi:sugar lactone lactonase YvrE